jgi:hypothetical protein
MVPAITGHKPNLFELLWTPIGGHRLPVQKAIYLILLKSSGDDFRIGGAANTIILGALSLAMIFNGASHSRANATGLMYFFRSRCFISDIWSISSSPSKFIW